MLCGDRNNFGLGASWCSWRWGSDIALLSLPGLKHEPGTLKHKETETLPGLDFAGILGLQGFGLGTGCIEKNAATLSQKTG